MQRKFLVILMAIWSALPGETNAQTTKPPINYLGITGTISHQKGEYKLVWSSHPETSFFKQEYLTSGDAFPKYKSMITIDFVVTDAKIDQAVNQKIGELRELKKSNPEVNFEVIRNKATGEQIIDCLIGQTAGNDKNSLIEHDIFRFKNVTAKTGQRGILLLAVSTRKYGQEIRPFLIKLKSDKTTLVSEVAKLPIPVVNIRM